MERTPPQVLFADLFRSVLYLKVPLPTLDGKATQSKEPERKEARSRVTKR